MKRRAKSEAELVVEALKEKKPIIYEEIVESIPVGEEPLPSDLKKKILKEAKTLAKGTTVEVPIHKGAFKVKALLSWAYEDIVDVEILGFVPTVESTSTEDTQRRKRLVKLINDLVLNNSYNAMSDQVYEKAYEQVLKSMVFRSFEAKVKDFDNRVYELGCKYNFDMEREFGRLPEQLRR